MSQARLSGSTPAADWRLRFEYVVIGMAGLAATIVAAAITAGNVEGKGAALAGLARASMVAVPIAVGLYARHSRPDNRFGRLLVVAGFGWFLTTFAESSDEVLYSIGRVAGWVVEIGLIWLILAFPSGRLSGRADRLLLGAAVAILAVLYLPTAVLVESFPTPSQFTSCEAGCPDNAFLIGSEPAFVGDVVVPLREALTMLLFLAVTLRMGQRVVRATPITRLTLLPVLLVAATRWTILALALVVRRVDPESPLVDALVWAVGARHSRARGGVPGGPPPAPPVRGGGVAAAGVGGPGCPRPRTTPGGAVDRGRRPDAGGGLPGGQPAALARRAGPAAGSRRSPARDAA